MIFNSSIDDSALLETMFQSAGEGLIVVNQEGKICLANPRVTEMFQFTSEDLLGKTIEILIPESKRQQHVHHRTGYVEKPRKRSMGGEMDLSGQRKDGSTFPIEVSLNHFSRDGHTFVMAMITDISIRKQAEKKLQELNSQLEELVEERTKELRKSENLYSAISRNFPKGTINVFDEHLDYVFVEGEDLYKAGITSERLVGTNYLKHLPLEIRSLIKTELSDVFKGQKKSLEVNIPKGSYLLNCVPLPDLDGEIRQILVVEQNITQQKKAEDEARNALKKEKELSELKSRFVSMASHEFRTPLSTILSSTDLIARYTSAVADEKRDKHLDRIRSNVKNLTAILNDFLSLSKLEEGKVNTVEEEILLCNFLRELADEMQEITKAGQKIMLECDKEITAYLDPQHLRTVLVNLISNAIKYSDENKQIGLRAELLANLIKIEVKDQGIGIPETEQERMFERFFRANNVTNIQGTGLGLNIVKRYVDLMQGNITFRSEEGAGSTFILEIPQVLKHDKEDSTN